MRHKLFLFVCIVGAISPAAAQTEPPTVSAVGRHVDYYAPDTIRVRCRIFAEGKTAASALEKLQANRGSPEKRLGTLKAAPRKQIGEPVQMQDKPQDNMAARMQAMMMGGKKE